MENCNDETWFRDSAGLFLEVSKAHPQAPTNVRPYNLVWLHDSGGCSRGALNVHKIRNVQRI